LVAWLPRLPYPPRPWILTTPCHLRVSSTTTIPRRSHAGPTPVLRRSHAGPPVDAIPLSIHLGPRSVRTGLVGAHERRAGTGNGVPHGATVGDDIPPRTHAASTRRPFADGMQPHARCGLPIPANPCQSLPIPANPPGASGVPMPHGLAEAAMLRSTGREHIQ